MSNAVPIANVLGRGTAFRSTDESRNKLDDNARACIDRCQTFKKEIIGKYRHKTGKSKSFGCMCPPGRPWPFPER